jgi:nucleoside-diphosphate-sugar epimerase
MSNKISVYGSTGFIGSRYCEMFPDSLPVPREQNDPLSDHVLYFISTTHNYNIFTDPHKDIDTNLTKMVNVLEACRKKNQNTIFNFVSSWFVYGMNCTLQTKESDICDPRGFYSITKRAAEQMLVCYCKTMGMNYRILRLTNIIGPGDRGVSAKKNAIQYMIRLLKNNEPVKLYDGGCNIRDFMYVDDACRAIDVCIRNSPVEETINISNSQPLSISEVINYAKKKLNSSSEIVSIETPDFHKVVQVTNVCLDNSKLLSYGYSPSIHTFEGIDRILEN